MYVCVCVSRWTAAKSRPQQITVKMKKNEAQMRIVKTQLAHTYDFPQEWAHTVACMCECMYELTT